MDVTSIARLATTMADTATKEQVSVAVLKKAMDIQASSALALIQALPSAQGAASLPAHLGQRLNVSA
jgi:hypothetical protein